MSEHYHFIGIGGAGMAPLAEILLQKNAVISGSDQVLNEKTEHLRVLGATVFGGHRAEHLPEIANLTVVYSSAVAADNPELALARRRGLRCLRRGEMLAEVAARYRRCAAISASHGKTGTTAMLTHILWENHYRPGFMIGGSVPGFPSSSSGDGEDLFITEADESDGTHTLLHPALGLVLNVEDDHAWSVGGEASLMANFHAFGRNSARLLYYAAGRAGTLFADHPNARLLNLPDTEDFMAVNWRMAKAAAMELTGLSEADCERTRGSFPGVARRMTEHFHSDLLTVIEDYAHHPTELHYSISTLRHRYPGAHLRVIFQPHRFARLERYLSLFAAELRRADSVIVTPVFAAWCERSPVDGAVLAREIGSKAIYSADGWAQTAELGLRERPADGRPLVLAVIGAGDIEQILPILIGRLATASPQ